MICLSPRCIFHDAVQRIIKKLPPFVVTVGVLVNNPIQSINLAVERCGIQVVKLHGDETPELIQGLVP